MTSTPTTLKLSEIEVVDGFNPRTEMDKHQLDQLAASIKANGLLQPVLVAPTDDGKGWRLVDGHRRHAAAKIARIKELPVAVRQTADGVTALAVIANLQREDLNPIDEANGFAQVMEVEGLNQRQLADRLSVSTSHVSDRLKLLKLLPAVRDLFADGSLPAIAGPFLEKAQRVSETLAYLLARGMVEERIDASRLGESEICDEALSAAVDRRIEVADQADQQLEPLTAWTEIHDGAAVKAVALHWPPERDKLKKKFAGLKNDWNWYPRWTAADIDKLRAFGGLFEHKVRTAEGETYTMALATEGSILLDLLAEKIEAREKELAKIKEQRAKTNTDHRADMKEAKEQREKEQRARRQATLEYNLALGDRILHRYENPEVTLRRLKLVAIAAAEGSDEAFGADGLTRVDRDLVQVQTIDGGDDVEVKRMDYDASAAMLRTLVSGAETTEQLFAVMLKCLIANAFSRNDWGRIDGVSIYDEDSEKLFEALLAAETEGLTDDLPEYVDPNEATDANSNGSAQQ